MSTLLIDKIYICVTNVPIGPHPKSTKGQGWATNLLFVFGGPLVIAKQAAKLDPPSASVPTRPREVRTYHPYRRPIFVLIEHRLTGAYLS